MAFLLLRFCYLFTDKKGTLSDALPLSLLRLHRFRPDIMPLILIFRLHLLRNTVELIQIFLPVLLFFLLFAHKITSGIVCASIRNTCITMLSPLSTLLLIISPYFSALKQQYFQRVLYAEINPLAESA